MTTRIRATAAVISVLAATLVGVTCTAAADTTITITQPPTPLGIGEKHSAFPGMVRDEDGMIRLVWRQGTDHYLKRDGNIALSFSEDEGNTWTPGDVIRIGGDHRDPSISNANGRTWLTWFAGSTANPAIGAFSQRDQWGPTVRVDNLPRAAMTAPIVQLPNGELGATYYGRQTGEAYDTCWIAWSKDGKTWTRNRITNMIGAGVHTSEPYLVVDGELTHVFYRWGIADGIGMRTSTDSGHTAGPQRKILSNASGRPTVFATSNGVLVMVYRKLPSKAAWIAYSADHGVTWLDGGELLAPPLGSPNGMTYAAMVETSPGEVLVVFGMESTVTSSTLYSARLAVQ
jgi:hypothetical protein